MNKDNLIGIDLSKHSFQGCLLDQHNSETFNRKFSRKRLVESFPQQKPLVVAKEACGSAHHWSRLVQRYGHQQSNTGIIQ